MGIDVYTWSDTLTSSDIGGYLKDSYGKNRMKTHFKNLMKQQATLKSYRTPSNVQQFIDLYGEQATVDAIADIQKYFQFQGMQGVTMGGLPTGSASLAIPPHDIKPSNTAISVIGEGLAGWLFQQLGMFAYARPIGISADLIFTDMQRNTFALVQVKTTQSAYIKDPILKDVVKDIDQASRVRDYASRYTYTCDLVGVIIKTVNDFEILHLQIELV